LISVSIDGESELWAPFMRELEFHESMDELDMLHLQLQTPIGSGRATILETLKAGVGYEVTVGERKLKGDVVRVLYRHSARRGQIIEAWGLETLHRLRNLRLSEVDDQTKDKIVEAVAKKGKLSGESQAVQATATEVVFLDDQALAAVKRLADERNFMVTSDGTNLVFAPRNVATGEAVAVPWITHAKDLELITDVSDVVTSVKVLGRDYVTDEAVEYDAKASDLVALNKGDTAIDARLANIGAQPIVVNLRQAAPTQSDCKELAKGRLQAAAERFVTGKVRCHDVRHAAVGAKLTLSDAPWPFSGTYIIQAVQHRLSQDGSYEATIHFFADSLPAPA